MGKKDMDKKQELARDITLLLIKGGVSRSKSIKNSDGNYELGEAIDPNNFFYNVMFRYSEEDLEKMLAALKEKL